MKFDLTISVTAILGIAAIISPIATAIINNRYQIKLKKLEMQQQKLEKTTYYIRSIFENYLRCAGRCIYNADREARKEYGEYYFLALSYAPESLSESFVKINDAIYQDDYNAAIHLLEELKPEINKLLKNM